METTEEPTEQLNARLTLKWSASGEFFFTDKDVILLAKELKQAQTKKNGGMVSEETKKAKRNRNNGKLVVPVPELLANCENDDIHLAWTYWFQLVLKIYKILKPERKKMGKRCLTEAEKKCRLAIFTHPSYQYYSCLTFFCRKENHIIFFIQPWAAKVLDKLLKKTTFEEITIFHCPSNGECITLAYAAIAAKLNGDKKPDGGS